MQRTLLASLLAAALCAPAAHAASVEAFSNATVQPEGPRPGSSGLAFFNIEGSDNGSFASYGVARFDLAAMKAGFDATYGAGLWLVDSVALRLTQANAGFTRDGDVDVYFTADDTTSIADDGSSPLEWSFGGAFAAASSFITGYTFTEVASGHVETRALFGGGAAPSAGGSALADDIRNDSVVTLSLVDAEAGVAATYAGYTNFSYEGPTLVVNVTAVPEPGTYALMLAGLGLVGFAARRRARA